MEVKRYEESLLWRDSITACSVITVPPKYVHDELTFLSQDSSLVGCYAVSSG